MNEREPVPSVRIDHRAFLAGVSDSPLYGVLYMGKMDAALREVDPHVLPDLLADIVLKAPTDNESWLSLNARAGYAEEIYPQAALNAFARAATDPRLAAGLVERLESADQEEVAKRAGLFVKSAARRALMTQGSSMEACSILTIWACNQLGDQPLKAATFTHELHNRGPQEIGQLQAALEQAGHADVSAGIQEWRELHAAELAARAEREREQLEARRRLEQERAAREALRQAEEARIDRIHEDPTTALLEYADEMGIENPAGVEALTPGQVEALILPANVLLGRRRDVVEEPRPRDADARQVATAVMDRALALRRSGHEFVRYDYQVVQYESRPVIHATSEQAFWSELAKFAEWNEVTPDSVGSLYKQWRDNYVEWRRHERAKQVLAESGSSLEEFIPEGCTNIEVAPQGGVVTYDNLQDLIADMRRYYVPRVERFDSMSAAFDEISNSMGGNPRIMGMMAAIGALSGIDDKSIMDRIEQEILAWEPTGEQYYRDSADYGGGDPYKYVVTTFSGQGIGIERNPDGTYALSISGRGYNMNPDNPADFVERFAYVNNRNVTYSNGLRITYVVAPLDALETSLLPGWRDDEPEEYAKVRIPMANILQTLGRTLGTGIANVHEVAQMIVDGESMYPGVTLGWGNYAVRLGVLGRDMTYDATTGDVTAYEYVRQVDKTTKEVSLAQSEAQVAINIDVPGAMQGLAERLLAAKTLLHARPNHSRVRQQTIRTVA